MADRREKAGGVGGGGGRDGTGRDDKSGLLLERKRMQQTETKGYECHEKGKCALKHILVLFANVNK